MPTLHEIKQKLKKQYSEEQGRKQLREEDLSKIYVLFMMEFGWIPRKEFNAIPLPEFWEIYGILQDKWESEKKQHDELMEKTKK